MSNNWSKTVSKINRERYQIPKGWDTKEQIAVNLKCAPERVPDLLKPGITLGDIERQSFPVWDEARRMAVQVVCYRIVRDDTGEASHADKEVVFTTKPTKVVTGSDNDKTARIRAAILRYPHLSNYDVSRKLHHSSAVEVGEVRRLM